MYLQKMNGYSDYETAYAAMSLDLGNVLGGVLIGYLTDLTYSRRTPLALLSILCACCMQVSLVFMTPENRIFFMFYVFCMGLFIGGAIAIIAGISCADLGKLK
jgi:sugar phosphate permease